MILILTYVVIVFFRCLYKHGLKFTKTSIGWQALSTIKMQERLTQKYERWDHTGSIKKQTPACIWERILET